MKTLQVILPKMLKKRIRFFPLLLLCLALPKAPVNAFVNQHQKQHGIIEQNRMKLSPASWSNIPRKQPRVDEVPYPFWTQKAQDSDPKQMQSSIPISASSTVVPSNHQVPVQYAAPTPSSPSSIGMNSGTQAGLVNAYYSTPQNQQTYQPSPKKGFSYYYDFNSNSEGTIRAGMTQHSAESHTHSRPPKGGKNNHYRDNSIPNTAVQQQQAVNQYIQYDYNTQQTTHQQQYHEQQQQQQQQQLPPYYQQQQIGNEYHSSSYPSGNQYQVQWGQQNVVYYTTTAQDNTMTSVSPPVEQQQTSLFRSNISPFLHSRQTRWKEKANSRFDPHNPDDWGPRTPISAELNGDRSLLRLWD
jgi:hypothetical protein